MSRGTGFKFAPTPKPHVRESALAPVCSSWPGSVRCSGHCEQERVVLPRFSRLLTHTHPEWSKCHWMFYGHACLIVSPTSKGQRSWSVFWDICIVVEYLLVLLHVLSPVHVLSSQYFILVFNLFLLSCDVGRVNGALNSMLVGVWLSVCPIRVQHELIKVIIQDTTSYWMLALICFILMWG